MSKPKQPPTITELKELWRQYFIKMDKFRARHRKDNKLYYERHTGKEQARKKLWRSNNPRYISEYNNRPEVRAKAIERLHKYIESHPYCDLEKMEYLIRVNERTASLAKVS